MTNFKLENQAMSQYGDQLYPILDSDWLVAVDALVPGVETSFYGVKASLPVEKGVDPQGELYTREFVVQENLTDFLRAYVADPR